MTSVLEVKGANVRERLSATDLIVQSGQLIALIGPNGSGKTSLLRACAAIDGAANVLRVAGEDLRRAPPGRRPRLLGYVPASRDVVWPIAVRDIIGMGLASPAPGRVDDMLDLLELRSLADRPTDRLSTGERARVLLARALAPSPKVLLLDEPLANLDPYWVLRLLELLRQIADQGAAVIVALHDIERIGAFDRVLLMNQGALIADLPSEAMEASPLLGEAFRLDRSGQGWEIRRRAGPRSSP